MVETAFTPLMPRDRFDPLTNPPVPKQPAVNPVIPRDVQPQSIEDRIKAEGSGTSFLTSLTAWLGAAKGDFRGLQQLEEQKRRTALAKSMVPDMRKISDLANSGKWEEAANYSNEMLASYGNRAPELVPYIQEMQARINRKQEGWETLKAIRDMYKNAGVTEGTPQYSAFKALDAAVQGRSQIDQTTLQGFLTRNAPHIQNLEGVVYMTDPSSGKTVRDIQPQAYRDKDFDSVTGLKTATMAGLTPQSLADLFNDRVVKREDGTVVQPGSREAQLVKAYYISQQPTEARLKLVQSIPLDPAMSLQLLRDFTPEQIALRDFGPNRSTAIDAALKGQADRVLQQAIATKQAEVEADPTKIDQSGNIVIGKDPNDPSTFFIPQQLVPLATVEASKGKLGTLNKDVYAKQVIPAFGSIQNLDKLNTLLTINPLETKGEVIRAGVNQYISSWLGYPVTKQVEVRETAKTILRSATEEAYNVIIGMPSVSGRDKKEIADLKAYTAGDFVSTKDILKASKRVRVMLNDVLRRATGVTIPEEGEAAQTPAQAISKVIPRKGNIIQPPSTLSPEEQENIRLIEQEAIKSGKGGNIRIPAPVGGVTAPPVSTAPPLTAPMEQPLSAEERVKRAMQQKRMERMR